ncbi:MAG: WG repeat-containing protein [Bacteroidota bacterium]
MKTKMVNQVLNTLLLLTVFWSSCGDINSNIKEIELLPVRTGRVFQYVDYNGKIIVNPQFAHASVFNDGLALVKTTGRDGKFGFIGPDGKYVIMPTLKQATSFKEGLAWIVEESSFPVAIDNTGKPIVNLKNAESARNYSDGVAAYSILTNNGLAWGFVDKTGKSVIRPNFKECGDFSEGMCVVKSPNRTYGYIDKSGKLTIPYQFEKAEPFSNGVAAVRSNRKWGLIDKSGRYLINPSFDELMVDGNMCIVKQNYRWGWTDHNGTFIINPQFSAALPFGKGDLAPFINDRYWGYVNKKGLIVVNPQFDKAFSFQNGIAAVANGRRLGFIDQNGKFVINPQFDGISNDYLSMIYNKEHEFNLAKTDFFNISAIVDRIDVRNPEGLGPDALFSDLINKYGLTANDFNKYSSTHAIVQRENITDNSLMNLSVDADLLNNSRELDLTSTISSFHYVVALQGRARNKEQSLMDAFEQSLSGFNKLDHNAYRQYKYRKIMVFTDGTKTVEIEDKYPGVHVRILLGEPLMN